MLKFLQRLIRAETRRASNQSLKRLDGEVVKLGQAALKGCLAEALKRRKMPLSACCVKKKEDAEAVFHCFQTATANGLHPLCEWKVFVRECDALFKSKHGGDREAQRWSRSIDCDRPGETCTPLLSVWGFSQCTHKSTVIARALESPQSAASTSGKAA